MPGVLARAVTDVLSHISMKIGNERWHRSETFWLMATSLALPLLGLVLAAIFSMLTGD